MVNSNSVQFFPVRRSNERLGHLRTPSPRPQACEIVIYDSMSSSGGIPPESQVRKAHCKRLILPQPMRHGELLASHLNFVGVIGAFP